MLALESLQHIIPGPFRRSPRRVQLVCASPKPVGGRVVVATVEMVAMDGMIEEWRRRI